MSNHYYSQQGEPVYTITGSNGKERNTTVRDARKLNLVPSYSTITSVMAKPGLEVWKENQLLEACIDWPFDGAWSDADEYEEYKSEDFIKQWKKDVRNIADRMGKEGRERTLPRGISQ